jgi:hypothetical protein
MDDESIFPVEFITTTKKNSNELSDSVILTTIEYLLSLNWPVCPKPPPIVDIGTSIENFLLNIINKNKLGVKNDDLDLKCKLPEKNEQNVEKKLDYNELLKVLQQVLEQSKSSSN